MSASQKLVFGTSIRQQVATRIQAHIDEKFAGNSAKAAKSLGISRQRLFSYTTAKTMPRAPMFEAILQKWQLNLVGKEARGGPVTFGRGTVQKPRSVQGLLFDSPITLKSDELKVVIKRKGPRLVASIEISADVQIA